MMQYIRQNIKIVGGVIIFVVAAFIGTIFLVWGRGGDTGGDEGVIAWVGDTPIYQREHDELNRSLMQFYRSIYKDFSESEIERRFKISETSLESLINRRAVLIEARSRGMKVSEDEISRKIKENPAFQRDGRFDSALYLQRVQLVNKTPEQFETAQENDILIEKMEALIKEGTKVTEEEALLDYKRTNEKLSLEYVHVPLDIFSSRVKIEDADLESYFAENKQKYFQPERIQLDYVRIDPGTLDTGEKPGDEAVSLFYEEHSSEFATPKKVKASHILFKLDKDAPEEDEARIRERAALVLEKARGGADFAALAREFSQDVTGRDGGGLGYFAKSEMVPEFSNAAFALPNGGISDLVRTQFGFHIIKVDDIREAGTETPEEARDKIIARMKADAAREKAREISDEVYDALLDESLEAVASNMGLELRKSRYFAMDEPEPGLPLPDEIREPLFGLNDQEVSDEIQWGNIRYYFQLVGRRAGHLPDLEEVRELIFADLTNDRARTLAQEEAEGLRKDIESGTTIAQAAAKGNYIYSKADPFAKSGFLSELGVPGSRFTEAFSLDAGAVIGPVEAGGGYIVCRILEKMPVDMADFENEKENIKSKLWDLNSERFFQAWVEGLRGRIGVRMEGEAEQL